jgi:hypothetical protein
MSFKFSDRIEFLRGEDCHVNILTLLRHPGILRISLSSTPWFFAKNLKVSLTNAENPHVDISLSFGLFLGFFPLPCISLLDSIPKTRRCHQSKLSCAYAFEFIYVVKARREQYGGRPVFRRTRIPAPTAAAQNILVKCGEGRSPGSEQI